MKDNHQCVLLGPKGCKAYIDPDADAVDTPVSPTPLFLGLSLLKGIWLQLFNPRPDVVIGGSGLVGPVVVLLAKLFGAKSIILVHGLDIIVDSRIYQLLFVPFLTRADLIICNSKNTARLAVESGIRQERIEVINPGVDLPKDPMPQHKAKKLLGLEGNTLLLSVGRLIPRKGLAEFISNAFVDLAAKDSNVRLLIAGSESKNALNRHGESVLEKINSAIESNGLENKIQFFGWVDDENLELLYAAADVFIFPLKETHGDVEGFGMVSIEAAAHGTPTVAFDCGGVGDAIESGKNGYLVPSGNYAEFARVVGKLANENMRQSSKAFAQKFSWKNYYRKLHGCIEKVVR